MSVRVDIMRALEVLVYMPAPCDVLQILHSHQPSVY